MEWIRNWCFLCLLEDVIESDENPESYIGKERDNIWVYMLMSWKLGWAFGICGLGLLLQIIIFYYFNFLSQLVKARIIFHSPSFIKITFEKTLPVIIFCAFFILCQRERKRHWVVRKARPYMLRFHIVDHFILGGRRSWVSKHHSDCVMSEICFKEIMANTRIDMNHSLFTHLVCEFLIICRFLLIYIFSICLLLLTITSICVIVYS